MSPRYSKFIITKLMTCQSQFYLLFKFAMLYCLIHYFKISLKLTSFSLPTKGLAKLCKSDISSVPNKNFWVLGTWVTSICNQLWIPNSNDIFSTGFSLRKYTDHWNDCSIICRFYTGQFLSEILFSISFCFYSLNKVLLPRYCKHFKKVLTKAIWAAKKWAGFCTSSKTEILNKIGI